MHRDLDFAELNGVDDDIAGDSIKIGKVSFITDKEVVCWNLPWEKLQIKILSSFITRKMWLVKDLL